MDAAFASQAKHGFSFLSDAGQSLGCVYICVWSYLPHSANYLACTDGWFHEENHSLGRQLFDLYRRSFFNIETGCFPGLTFKDKLDYLEVDEPRLTSLAGIPSQRLFYQEAGIKVAVFISQSDGEIEIGWSRNASLEEMRERIMSLFSGRERFLNVPETPHRREFLPFPSPDKEDTALVTAFLQVLSSSSPSSLMSAREGSAFSPYGIGREPIIRAATSVPGQRMLKSVFSTMTRIESSKGYGRNQASSHQVISERKRRERLNQSFAALRNLLPSEFRMDRVSLLERARESINAMRSQISNLEESNRTLRTHLKTPEEPAGEESSGERVEIRVNRCSEPSSSSSSLSSASSSRKSMKIALRITVRTKVDSARLLLPILACLKEMGNIELDSMQARGSSCQVIILRLTTLNFQSEGREWEEASFVEAVSRTINRSMFFEE